MKPTLSNLLIFVMANGSYNNGELSCYTREGKHRLEALVKSKAQVKMTQARFFKTRKERWEYLLDKHPDLELIKSML